LVLLVPWWNLLTCQILKDLQHVNKLGQKSEYVWLNENLVPLEEARVSVNDRGFLYGDGLFETLRADQGRVHFLEEHLVRLESSARVWRLPFPADFPWEKRIGQVLAANGLEQGPAAVKLQITRGEATGLGLPTTAAPTLVIWGRPYEPPAAAEYAAGWPVVTFPERRSTFVGAHKSLNYLFYLAARQYALDQGAREAIILEADGLVSEGAATSLLFRREDRWYTPAARSALPGVTMLKLRQALAARHTPLTEAPTTVAMLRGAQGIWLTNSLMGVMPVAHWDGQPVPRSDLTPWLQDLLFSGET
jgi:branched-chain amino acid aminotransferase/para-aminobenzoate synthetase component 1